MVRVFFQKSSVLRVIANEAFGDEYSRRFDRWNDFLNIMIKTLNNNKLLKKNIYKGKPIKDNGLHRIGNDSSNFKYITAFAESFPKKEMCYQTFLYKCTVFTNQENHKKWKKLSIK